jgi:hypothetical protein
VVPKKARARRKASKTRTLALPLRVGARTGWARPGRGPIQATHTLSSGLDLVLAEPSLVEKAHAFEVRASINVLPRQ